MKCQKSRKESKSYGAQYYVCNDVSSIDYFNFNCEIVWIINKNLDFLTARLMSGKSQSNIVEHQ